MMKKWRLLYSEKVSKEKSKQEILKILFNNRDLDWGKGKEFFKPVHPKNIPPEQVKLNSDNLKAAKNLIKEQSGKGKVIIYGDYDVDGLTAAAILWRTLNQQGVDVVPFIPNREDEGYGLKQKVIAGLINKYKDLSLIITVDNGIVAHEAVEYAKKQGISVVITDHHLAGKTKPDADVVIHTTEISGCGVAWFLAREFGYKKLSLAAVGTIADMLPLTGVNRSFVKYGLKELNRPREVGLRALKKIAGLESGQVLPWQVSFILAPRLNAAGRLNQPLTALRLLCTDNKVQAGQLAVELNRMNRERQQLTEKGLEIAKQENWADSKLLLTSARDYHQGIIGLIAGKLSQEFGRPSIAIWQGKEVCKGSARSVSGCNIVEIIRQAGDILESFGGHEMAAGFTVKTENLKKLENRLQEIAEERIVEELLHKSLKVDFVLDFSLINKDFYRLTKRLGPFGIGNPKPCFVLNQARIVDINTMGDKNQHLKLFLDDPQTAAIERIEAEAVGFGWGDWANKILPGDLVDLVFNFNLNQWNGKETLQLKIKDLRKSE